MTYYKYAERNVERQMDWSKVGQDISQGLAQESQLREKKKAQLEGATDNIIKRLQDIPDGEHRGMHNWALDMTASVKEMALMNKRLLTSGQMKPNEYLKRVQNISDGTDTVLNLVKGYQAEYGKKMERYNKGESSYREVKEMEWLEGLSNFAETSVYIDPNTNLMSIGKLTKNPETGMMEISKDPKDLAPLHVLNNRLKSEYNKYDVDAITTNAAKAFGKDIRVVKDGDILTLDDVAGKPEFEKAEENFINSLLTNPDNASSILVDFIKTNPETGQTYDFTLDANNTDPNMILLATNPNESSGKLIPQLTSEQEAVIKDRVRQTLRSKLNVVETPMADPKPTSSYQLTEWQAKLRDNEKKQKEATGMAGLLYYGNDTELTKAVNYFTGNDESIMNINRTDKGIELTTRLSKGELATETIPFYDANGNLLSQADFIQGVTKLTGLTDVSKALKNNWFDPERGFNKDGKATYKREVQEEMKKISDYTSATVGKGEDNIPLEKKVTSAIAKNEDLPLNQKLRAGLRTAISAQGSDYSDRFTVSANSDGSLTITLPRVFDKPIKISKLNEKNFVETIIPLLYDANKYGTKMTSQEFLAKIGGKATPKTTTPKEIKTTVTGGEIR
jgi:hypothetical protein